MTSEIITFLMERFGNVYFETSAPDSHFFTIDEPTYEAQHWL